MYGQSYSEYTQNATKSQVSRRKTITRLIISFCIFFCVYTKFVFTNTQNGCPVVCGVFFNNNSGVLGAPLSRRWHVFPYHTNGFSVSFLLLLLLGYKYCFISFFQHLISTHFLYITCFEITFRFIL